MGLRIQSNAACLIWLAKHEQTGKEKRKKGTRNVFPLAGLQRARLSRRDSCPATAPRTETKRTIVAAFHSDSLGVYAVANYGEWIG